MSGAATEAHLVEIFSSVQGEGPDVGRSTLFVRFGECDLRCRWCDSPNTWTRRPHCRVESERGGEASAEVPNPLSVSRVVELAEGLGLRRHAMVAITGGEPLLQPEAVGALLERIGPSGPERLLETHGLHTDALTRVIEHVDVVSMDWKLATDVRRRDEEESSPGEGFHAVHESFLEVARAARRVVVKLVVTTASTDAELDEAFHRVATAHPEASLVLQPVTPFGQVRETPSAGRLLALARRAEERLADVRLVPQTHPLIGVR